MRLGDVEGRWGSDGGGAGGGDTCLRGGRALW